ncbi:MAG: thiolase domain-containing protein [Pseudomonadota bacterium]
MREVAIVGVGSTAFGELWTRSLRTLFVEAALAAMKDAGIDRVDSMVVGCMSGGLFVGQEHLGALLADNLGQKSIPATRVESACASGGAALRAGFMEVASGVHDVVLVGGVEKMTDVGGDKATFALATASDQEWEAFQGATFPGLYAMMAKAHMHRYGTTSEQLASVAVKNHENGAKNPRAQFPGRITVEEVLKSVMVADPLHVLDCSPISDGAAAVVLCAAEKIKISKTRRPVFITGVGQATDTMALHDRSDLCALQSVTEAARRAYAMAGRKPGDIQLCEVHDCFTIAEIMAVEALGLVEKGHGGHATVAGETKLGGRIPVNTSGGLKSKGHPVGATGVAQAVEIVEQLRGEAGARQVRDARVGMTQNMGGTGASAVVHIMEAR